MSKLKAKVKSILDVSVKHPTSKGDFVAYANGANKSYDVAYTDYIKSVETIDRIIRLHANILSLAQPKILKKDAKGNLSPMKVTNIDLDFLNTLDTRVDFLRKVGVALYSQGASLIVGETGANKVIGFYPLDMAKVKINSSAKELIKEFIYTADDSQEFVYKPADCIYINDSIDPSNLIYSLSRLQSLNDVILIQAGIVDKTKTSIEGGAKDSFIIAAKSPLSKDTQAKIKASFDSFMKSSAASSLFLNTELDYHQVGNSMTGGEMLSYFTKVNQMMIDHFNIPPALLGDYSASGANKNEELIYSLRVWFTTMMRPIIYNIELAFTRYLVNTLGLKNAVFKLDLSDLDILDDPIDIKVERAIKLHKSGIMSFNEARALCELPKIDTESADLHFLPQYLTGSAPISLENYDAEVERLLQGVASNNQDTSVSDASGNAGDEDNTNVEDGTRGGDASQGN